MSSQIPGAKFGAHFGGGLAQGGIITGLKAYAQLPAADTCPSMRATVNDSNTNVFLAVVAGGGANIVPVFSDGTDWRVG